MVAWGVSAIAADSETRIERKARLRCSPGLIQLTEVRQGSREIEMRMGNFGWPQGSGAAKQSLRRRRRCQSLARPTNMLQI